MGHLLLEFAFQSHSELFVMTPMAQKQCTIFFYYKTYLSAEKMGGGRSVPLTLHCDVFQHTALIKFNRRGHL